MPGRNLEKVYLENSYYHVYSRGHNKQVIFRDEQDYAVFLNLFKRYLSQKPVKDKKNREYPHYYGELGLLAFCLMPTHIHALVYQNSPEVMTKLFQSLMTTYGMYFNKKYKQRGPVFESRFRASLISTDTYLQHITRYIHLNPKNYRQWKYSSLPFYSGEQKAEWLQPDKILGLFKNKNEYLDFVQDYEDYKEMLDELKYELADTNSLKD